MHSAFVPASSRGGVLVLPGLSGWHPRKHVGPAGDEGWKLRRKVEGEGLLVGKAGPTGRPRAGRWLGSPQLSVCLGCHNKTPRTGWGDGGLNSQHRLLLVLETGGLNSERQCSQVLVKTLPGLQRAAFLLCPHRIQGEGRYLFLHLLRTQPYPIRAPPL